MPTYYCSANGCGHRVTYEIVKPISCPKCKTVFASLTKALSAVSVAAPAPVAAPSSIASFHNEEKPVRLSPTKQRMLERAAAARHGPDDEEDEEEEENSNAAIGLQSKNSLRSHMHNLAAAITIKLEPVANSEDSESIKWEDLIKEGSK